MDYYHAGKTERNYVPKEAYETYLTTDKWHMLADTRRSIDKGVCQYCRKQNNHLQVHHLTYFNIMKESPWTDLVCLCPECHKNIHRMMERVTSPDGRRGWKSLPYTQHIWTPDKGV